MTSLKNLKSIITSLLSLADTVSDVLSDGKINLIDIDNLVKLPTILIGFKSVTGLPQELKHFTSLEVAELKRHAQSELERLKADRQSDNIEIATEKVIQVALDLSNLIYSFKN